MSRSNIYEDNNCAKNVATSPIINPTLTQISVKYHWFRNHIRKEFEIQKIESENKKADILAKGLQVGLSIRLSKLV